MAWVTGVGRYAWLDAEGVRHDATHWDDIPAEIDELIAFVPDTAPEPHTQEDHDAMNAFGAKFDEVFARTRDRRAKRS